MPPIKLLVLLALLPISGCVVVEEGPTQNEKASKINVQLGIGYYNQGNLELANEKLLRALDQDPKSSQAHHAYAVLQNRFLDAEKAEFHFQRAIDLNDSNSEALNNYGAFLCRAKRYDEAKTMFLQAVDNPLYKTPEVAYTNAALCLRQTDSDPKQVKQLLTRALGVGSNFAPALLAMAEISLAEQDYEKTVLYLRRFLLSNQHTAASLWLAIQNELNANNHEDAENLAAQLQQKFPQSKEYQSWLEVSK